MYEIFARRPGRSPFALIHTLPFKSNSNSNPHRTRIRALRLRGAGLTAALSFCLPIALSGCGDAVRAAGAPTGKTGAVSAGSAAVVSVLPEVLACDTEFVEGAVTDGCTITLASATSSAQTVILSSDNPAVTVPSTVTVQANASTATFTATAAAVSSAQTATLTATTGGLSKTYTLRLSASVAASNPALSLSTNSMSFGNVSVSAGATSQSVTLTSSGSSALTISSVKVTGTGFTLAAVSLPMTLNPGQSATVTVQFDPSTEGSVTGTLTISSNNSSGGTATISLSGTGTASTSTGGGTTGGGSGTGSSGSSGSGSSSGGSSGGTQAALISPAPGSVLSGSSATFTWSTVSGVMEYQLWVGTEGAGSGDIDIYTVGSTSAGTLSANVSDIPISGATLYVRLFTYNASTGSWVASDYTYVEAAKAVAAQPSTAALSLSSASVAFGKVALNTPATQSVVLTSSGTAPLTIDAVGLAGGGFSISGISFPLTLNPGGKATLSVQFNPTATGAAAGTLVLTSNASAGGTTTISLTGTGTTQASDYAVDLKWNEPADSSDPYPIAGYNIYRALKGSSLFQLLNGSLNVTTTYTDNTVADGSSYDYQVTTVDSAGNESVPSGVIALAIPAS